MEIHFLYLIYFDQKPPCSRKVDSPIAHGEFALPFPLERAGWSGIKI
jgi:hypothetical protein